MKRKVLFTLLVVAVVSSLAFIGCAAPAPAPAPIAPAPGPTPSPVPGPAAPTPAPAPTPPPAGPQYGGILKILEKEGPMLFTAPWECEMGYTPPACCCVEGLVRLDTMGRPVPWLATSWEEDPEGKFAIVYLREGVKFHDGTDFNAEAVKINLDMHMDYWPWDLTNVESIDVIDEYTVRFNFMFYSNSFWTELGNDPCFIASPTAIAIEATPEEKPYKHAVGTGPFKFKDWRRDVFIEFERFDDYWDEGKPYLEGVRFDFIRDAVTRQTAFLAGQAHMILSLSAKSAGDLEAIGYETLAVPAGLIMLCPDSLNPDSPFADKRVREAVEYAIDRPAIVEAFGYGYLEACHQHCPSDQFAYIPDFEGRPYDPDKARQLLAVAGYPDGFETSILALIERDRDQLVAIQGYLGEVGIDVKLEIQEPGTMMETVEVGWNNALVASWPSGCDPNYTNCLKREFEGIEHPYMWHVSTALPPGWEEALLAAVGAMDKESQTVLTQELVRMIHDYAMVIPLWTDPMIGAQDRSVHDTGFYEIHFMLWNPADAWLSH